MLDNCTTKEERWGGVSELIARWLQERQELIVLYCSLTGSYAFSSHNSKSQQKLNKFCQIMMDYVSAGHFEVYDQLTREAEDFNEDSEELLGTIYPKIQITTEIALEFNDRYTTSDGKKLDEKDEHSLNERLSKLGEVLVSRFDLEDQLINALHNSHADLVA